MLKAKHLDRALKHDELLARARDQARSATTEGRGPKDAEPGPLADAPKNEAATAGVAPTQDQAVAIDFFIRNPSMALLALKWWTGPRAEPAGCTKTWDEAVAGLSGEDRAGGLVAVRLAARYLAAVEMNGPAYPGELEEAEKGLRAAILAAAGHDAPGDAK